MLSQETQTARDDWMVQAVRNDCEGCESRYEADGYETWIPARDCPVHGLNQAEWWKMINERLDERWPRLPERCAVCGGLNPGDITHTRCL